MSFGIAGQDLLGRIDHLGWLPELLVGGEEELQPVHLEVGVRIFFLPRVQQCQLLGCVGLLGDGVVERIFLLILVLLLLLCRRRRRRLTALRRLAGLCAEPSMTPAIAITVIPVSLRKKCCTCCLLPMSSRKF
jgi:hypothetical protein